MPAKFFTRILPAAVVAAGLVFSAPAAADAAATKSKTTKTSKKVVAKIALGDKRKAGAPEGRVSNDDQTVAQTDPDDDLPF